MATSGFTLAFGLAPDLCPAGVLTLTLTLTLTPYPNPKPNPSPNPNPNPNPTPDLCPADRWLGGLQALFFLCYFVNGLIGALAETNPTPSP